MRVLLLPLMLFSALVVLACGGSSKSTASRDTISTPSGLRYVVIREGDGDIAAVGDRLLVDYAGYLTDGRVFDTSIDSIANIHGLETGGSRRPIQFRLGGGEVIKGWDEAFALNMRVGESRRLIIPPSLGYGTKGSGAIPPSALLVFDVHLLKILPEDTVTTMDGLRYIDRLPGKGKLIQKGMQVKVDYAGYLMSGKLFDTSIEAVGTEHGYDRGGYPFEPFSFTAGRGEVIQGWDIGLTTNMRVGGRRRLIVPPGLGYGQYGSPPTIPPNATLVFDVEVLEAR